MRDCQHYNQTQTKVKEQLVVRKDMDVNEHERLFNITLKTQIKVKEQLVVRKDIDVNEHERLFNITLQTQIKVKEQLVVRKGMGVNEHERLSNITLQTQIKVKGKHCYGCSTFHSHNFNFHKFSRNSNTFIMLIFMLFLK